MLKGEFHGFLLLPYTSRQLSIMGPGRYFSVRSLYLFECSLYYKGVFSECQRLSDCKYAKTVVHISLFFRHTTQCQTCTVFTPVNCAIFTNKGGAVVWQCRCCAR